MPAACRPFYSLFVFCSSTRFFSRRRQRAGWRRQPSRGPIEQVPALFEKRRGGRLKPRLVGLPALPSGVALVGPFQFLLAIRNRWPKAHRHLGRLYLLCVLAGSCAAISATVMRAAGVHAQVGFGLLVVCWLLLGWQSYRAARQRRFRDHRIR
ncbi:DUF2306 domain-containing protein [Ensifer sp. ENS08]|nr:DUF2306 domain-containing protein [Ensifer sp. ENS08]